MYAKGTFGDGGGSASLEETVSRGILHFILLDENGFHKEDV